MFRKEVSRHLLKCFKHTYTNCFQGNQYIEKTIYTNLYEVEYKNIFTGKRDIGYKIEQHIPLIHKPFWDGEYSTNSLLKSKAIEEKALAQYYLDTEVRNR